MEGDETRPVTRSSVLHDDKKKHKENLMLAKTYDESRPVRTVRKHEYVAGDIVMVFKDTKELKLYERVIEEDEEKVTTVFPMKKIK